MDRGCRPHHRLRAAHALRLTGKKKRSRARLFFTRKSEFLYLSISLECVCSSRQRRQSGAVCSLQFSLPQKPPSEKISVYLDRRDRRLKSSFSIRFFLIGPKIETFFLFQTTEERKARKGEKTRNFLFFLSEHEKAKKKKNNNNNSFFSLFFFSLSRALSRGEKGQHKKKHKKETRFTVDTPARSNERNIDFPVRFHSSASAV